MEVSFWRDRICEITNLCPKDYVLKVDAIKQFNMEEVLANPLLVKKERNLCVVFTTRKRHDEFLKPLMLVCSGVEFILNKLHTLITECEKGKIKILWIGTIRDYEYIEYKHNVKLNSEKRLMNSLTQELHLKEDFE